MAKHSSNVITPMPRIAVVRLLCALTIAIAMTPAIVAPEAALAKPQNVRVLSFASGEPAWTVVNDDVMGGVSSSRVSTRAGVLTFAGRVRLENNGGFASTRSRSVTERSNTALSQGNAVRVRLRGDGSTYQLTFDTGQGWYWASVTPPARGWTNMTIPYSDLEPRGRFGKPSEGASYAGQPLRAIGILIGNGRAEQFALSIDWLDVLP